MRAIAFASGLLCATTLAFSAATQASASNLVINGSFEDQGLTSGTWKAFGANQVNGWTPTEGSTIEIRNNKVGTAYDGQHFVEVDSHGYDKSKASAGEIEVGLFQNIMTEVGKKYRLSFVYGPRNGVNGDNLLGISFGDMSESLNAGNSGEGWKLFEETITATSNMTQLKFVTQGKFDTLGANIDDVSVETVPEPMSVVSVIAVGAIVAGGALKKNKQQTA